MKNTTLLLLLLLAATGFTQSGKYELPQRNSPTVKKDKIAQALYVTDLSPLLWSSLQLPYIERYRLEQRRVNEYPQPANYIYPQQKYKQLLTYVSVEISATCNGTLLSAQSNTDLLTPEQKNILNAVENGAAVSVKVKFRYKNQKADSYGERNKVVEGETTVTVVPPTEAEFPGGLKQLSTYFEGSVINRASQTNAAEKIEMAIVKFTITEAGEVTGAQITRTTNNAEIDRLLLDALAKMPKWKPAKNAKGENIKQEITLPFGSGGC